MPRRGTLPLVVLLVAWAAVYVPPLCKGRYLPARDLAATHLPWRVVWAGQVRAGTVPLWDPASNQGRPLLANPNAMAAYPGTLLFLLPSPELAELVHIALHHLLLLGGCYVLARRGGASRGASAVAAATVGTGGVVWSATTFLNVLASLAWCPWALAPLVNPPDSPAAACRRGVAAGAMLGLAFLAGEPVLAALAGTVAAILVATGWPRPLTPWGLALAPAALAVAAPVLVPLLAIYHETARGALGAPAGALAADALAPRRFLELVLPSALGPPMADVGSGFWAAPSFPWQRYYPTVFLGPAALLLLPFARRCGRSLRVWWGLAAVAAALASALAFPPVAAVASRLPGLSHVRFAIKLLVVVALALVPLLAAGWEEVTRAPSPRRRRVALWYLLTVATLALAAGPAQPLWRCLLATAYPASAGNLAAIPSAALGAQLLVDCLALAIPAAVLLAGRWPALAVALAFAAGWLGGRGVLLFDARERWATPPVLLADTVAPPPTLYTLAPAAVEVPATVPPELRRFWAARGALVPGYATRWGAGYVLTRGPDGLEPLRQELLGALAATAAREERVRLAHALGASLVVADAPLPGLSGSWVDGVWVASLDGGGALAYLARRVLPAEGWSATIRTMGAATFRPGEDAVVERRGGAEVLAGGVVVRTWGVPHHRRFQVALTGPGLLVVRQSYLSSWRARVDGRPAPVQVVNGAQIGVRLPPGEHTVALFLSPLPYWLGASGPLLAAVTLGWPVARRWARRSASGARGRSTRATPPVP